MATTSTKFTWYWYVRKRGRQNYLGLIDDQGDDPAGAYTITVYYDQLPDELTADSDSIPLRPEYELAMIKGVAAELMGMFGGDPLKRELYKREYEEMLANAVHNQIEESYSPAVQKPFDLRDE